MLVLSSNEASNIRELRTACENALVRGGLLNTELSEHSVLVRTAVAAFLATKWPLGLRVIKAPPNMIASHVA